MLAIFAAMEQEISEIKRRMTVTGESFDGNCRIYQGKFGDRDGILVLTGMGKENAVRAVELVLKRFQVSLIISTGVAGALNSRTESGDFVLYTSIKCGDTKLEPANSNTQLLFLAENTLHKSGHRKLVGTGITTLEVCSTPGAKVKLGENSDADVVDMESYWLCKAASGRKIPFVIIRPVFDTVRDDVSSLSRITTEGKVIPSKLAAGLFTHPGMTAELIRYGNTTRKLAKSLAEFIYEYIEVLPQG